MALVHLVIGLALLEFFCFLHARSGARARHYKVPAPATTGHEVFERYFRVQMNTLEQLVIFVPAMLLFARYVNALRRSRPRRAVHHRPRRCTSTATCRPREARSSAS